MPKSPISAGTFLATVSPEERRIITDVQDKLRAERNAGAGFDSTIELPLKWCQEAIAMHRKGLASALALTTVLEEVLRHPEKAVSVEAAVEAHGLWALHERGDPQLELAKLTTHHDAWRQLYANEPQKAINAATRAVMIAGNGMCNPAHIRTAVLSFFSAA